jgi:hypothetical protein
MWKHDPKFCLVITIKSLCAAVALCHDRAINILEFSGLDFIKFTIFTITYNTIFSVFGIFSTAIAYDTWYSGYRCITLCTHETVFYAGYVPPIIQSILFLWGCVPCACCSKTLHPRLHLSCTTVSGLSTSTALPLLGLDTTQLYHHGSDYHGQGSATVTL